MRIPFDIMYRPQIDSGEYTVKTKKGDDVKIILWPNYEMGQNTIVAKIGNTGNLTWYSFDGKDTSNNSDKDLVIINPNIELTDFEKGMIDYVRDIIECKNDDDVETVTREHSGKLLNIINSKQEKVLHNLPTWTKTDVDIQSNTLNFIIRFKDGDNTIIVPTNRVLAGEEFIEIGVLNSFLKSL